MFQKKILFFFFSFLFLFLSCQSQLMPNQFQIKGKIIGQADGIVSLTYVNENEKRIEDSSIIKGGWFSFSGFIEDPTIAYLRGNIKYNADIDPNAVSFFLEPGKKIIVEVKKEHFKDAKISGSKTQTENEEFQNEISKINKTSDSVTEKIAAIIYHYIIDNNQSSVSAFYLLIYSSQWPLDTVRMLYNNFSIELRNSNYGKLIDKLINRIEENSAGKESKEFSALSVNGEEVRLSKFRGKYVLLDFWASWCIPCRKGNPHLIKLYKKYHKMGFEIIGISADENKITWKRAIKKDGIDIWCHILGEKEGSPSVSKIYAVQVLPTKILVDKNGLIIGRYKGGEDDTELNKKLEEIFR